MRIEKAVLREAFTSFPLTAVQGRKKELHLAGYSKERVVVLVTLRRGRQPAHDVCGFPTAYTCVCPEIAL